MLDSIDGNDSMADDKEFEDGLPRFNDHEPGISADSTPFEIFQTLLDSTIVDDIIN